MQLPLKIPGSVCLPLHEVRKAFFMDMVVFEETYGFKWPDSRKWDYVLTCRSGRRVKVADRYAYVRMSVRLQ